MSSGALDPLANPLAWDVIRVGQTVSPGKANVGEIKRKHEFDVKKGKGTFGSTVTYVGRPPGTVSVEFELWIPSHFAQWDAFRPLLKYDPTKKSVQAVDVYYPAWDDVDFRSVVTESIGSIIHKGKGLYSITIEWLEYFPAGPKSAVSTPTSSVSTQAGTTPGKPPDAIGDAQQQEIANLFHQIAVP